MRLRVRELDLELPGWPHPGLRVALVADLHAGGGGIGPQEIARVVGAVNAADPDVVVLLGDFVDPTVRGGRRVAPEIVADRLAALQAPAVAVLGNHDWFHEGRSVGDALRGVGIRVLENEAVELRPGLWVAGVADLMTRTPRLPDTLRGLPDTAAVILLAHDPDVFPQVPARVALTLSGHTHGGQVGIPFLRRLWTPTRHGERFMSGHVVEGGRHLFVTRGIGFSRLPIRLFSPSELVVLRLLRAAPPPSR